MTKKLYSRIILATGILIIITLVMVSYVYLSRNDNDQASINDDLVAMNEFQLSDPNSGTSAKGTIFVMDYGDSFDVRIVAQIHVGVDDFGGVSFYSKHELEPNDVLCSYRGDTSDEYVLVTKNVSKYREFSSCVTIARDYECRPSGGGDGTVIICFKSTEPLSLDNTDLLQFKIGVGSETTEDGIKVFGPTFETISVTLIEK